ncbi:MAG: XrtA/PEP-CTERM system histidine kinase PrsK [Gammaproteobacteria bacterium]
MLNIGVVSYTTGAVAFLILALVLLTGWQGRLQGGLLVLASTVSAVWAAGLGLQAAGYWPMPELTSVLETLRFVVWLTFLLRLLDYANAPEQRRLVRLGAVAIYSVSTLLIILPPAYPLLAGWTPSPEAAGKFVFVGYAVLAVSGLWLVELLFRNTKQEKRWAAKFLCLGIGGMFAYDFFMYSDALLFKHIDVRYWSARGAIDALVVPFIAVSAARNPQWSLDVFVSRRIVFHTATLLSAGTYLLLMAAAGYYINVFGGHWGPVLQIVFLFGAGVVLLALMFSGQLRAQLKVFVSKNFFNYQYDYREEWLRFTGTLSRCRERAQPKECVIRAIANIVESPSGVLWGGDGDTLYPLARWNMPEFLQLSEPADSDFVRFLERRNWVIDLDEVEQSPERYEGMELPSWLSAMPKAWLVVPLPDEGRLRGFVVLSRPRARVEFDWEVRDLLKTAACQAASYLGQLDAVKALAEARQFEGFNRLSAFILHDLKNLIAQQSLIINSASKHKHNPAFIDDAVRIMEHSVTKMNRLMHLLRSGVSDTESVQLDLPRLLTAAVSGRSGQEPVPELINEAGGGVVVSADRDRLGAAIGNLVQNAQEATPKEGKVVVKLAWEGQRAVISVSDTGCGMDHAFVRERLFRPFDTTKGDTGMGIGAYETREYVLSLGGDLQVESAPGQGTTFRIALPAVRPEAVDRGGIEQREALG